jgi:hypothetical protein
MPAPEYSLLAELALRMAKSPEDVATEGVAYVLSRSAAARAAIQDLVSDWAQTRLREIVTFRSQVGSVDGSRPDIEAQDSAGAPVVIFENKFWAGLTDAQPVAYLRRLEIQGGVLCFVAPAERLRILWPEITRRTVASFPDLRIIRDDPHLKLARVDDGRILALTSWSFVLGQISRALEAHGDSALVADVRQLSGLAARMESSGFLPLTTTDLTAPTARHVIQFCGIVDAAVATILPEVWASKKGLKASGGAGWYGHYIRLRGHNALLAFSAPIWAEHGRSPLWCRLFSPNWLYPDTLERTVAGRMGSDAFVAIREGTRRGLWLPLQIPEGCERDQVIDHVVDQIRAIVNLLPELTIEAGDSAGPDEPELS